MMFFVVYLACIGGLMLVKRAADRIAHRRRRARSGLVLGLAYDRLRHWHH